jgi:hypothetical protein
MANLIFDAALSFGTKAAMATGQFPDIINLGLVPGSGDYYPDRTSTDADRMTVDVSCDGPAGGTSVVIAVEGSADGSSGWTVVGSRPFTLAELKAGICRVAISPNKFQYLRVSFTATGTFTAGTARAYLNTYAGK